MAEAPAAWGPLVLQQALMAVVRLSHSSHRCTQRGGTPMPVQLPPARPRAPRSTPKAQLRKHQKCPQPAKVSSQVKRPSPHPLLRALNVRALLICIVLTLICEGHKNDRKLHISLANLISQFRGGSWQIFCYS